MGSDGRRVIPGVVAVLQRRSGGRVDFVDFVLVHAPHQVVQCRPLLVLLEGLVVRANPHALPVVYREAVTAPAAAAGSSTMCFV